MFDVGWGVVLGSFVLLGIGGAIAGLVAGALAAFIVKTDRSRLAYYALLGGLIVPSSIVFFALLPWPENTISYTLSDGTTVTSTTDHFQHGQMVGWIVASLLQILLEALQRRDTRNA